jgi:hypothetical protein
VQKIRCLPLKISSLLACTVLLFASEPWKQDASRWNGRDTARILNDSPWSQPTPATFALAEQGPPPPVPIESIPQGAMPNPHTAATDGRWDGGVGRMRNNGPPSLTVLVRWDSALPVRQALARENKPLPYPPQQFQSHYILTIVGLVPGGRYDQPQLSSKSGDAPDPRNPESMLENVMRYSRLYVPGKITLTPDDARLDTATGALHLFFKRSGNITEKDKELFLETRFGSLSIQKRFRLKDMLYQGKLEL